MLSIVPVLPTSKVLWRTGDSFFQSFTLSIAYQAIYRFASACRPQKYPNGLFVVSASSRRPGYSFFLFFVIVVIKMKLMHEAMQDWCKNNCNHRKKRDTAIERVAS